MIDFETIRYFYESKGDPTSCSCWNEQKIKDECPELLYAYEQMVTTRKIFEIVLDKAVVQQRDRTSEEEEIFE